MKRRPWMWALGGAALALLGLSLGAAFLVWRLDPAAEIARRLEAATGRAVSIAGGVELTVFPNLGVTARDVTFANAEGAETPHMVAAKEVRIAVAARPLFERRLDIRALVLTEPRIALEVAEDGAANWVFPGAADAPAPQTELKALSLGDVRIVGGALTYFDRASKTRYALADIDAAARLDQLSGPLSIALSATRAGAPIEAQLTFGAADALIAGRRTPLAAQVSSPLLSARFDGAIAAEAGALAGRVNGRGDDLRRAIGLFAEPLPEGRGLGAFAIEGDVSLTDQGARFTNAKFALDAITGDGEVALAMIDKRLAIDGALRLGALDLNAYFAPAAAGAAGAPPPINVAEPGWSTAPIDLSGLKTFDMSLALTTGPVTVQNLRLDGAQGSVALARGLLRVRLDQVGLYGGVGEGLVEIDARGPGLRFAQDMRLNRVAADRFLADAANFRNLEGQAQIDLTVASSGASQRQLVEALDGEVRIALVDGALRGVNLAGVGRTIRAALSGDMVGPKARTPFKTFGGAFLINDGVAATSDFAVDATDAKITARGVLDLKTQSLDMIITPRADSILRRLGAPGAGVSAPFRVSGPWAKPTYRLDLSGARSAVTDRVRSVEASVADRLRQALPPGGRSPP